MATQIQTSDIADLAVTNAKQAGSIDLTAKVTGILPIANGGTGNALGNAEKWDLVIVSGADETANNVQNQDHTQFQAAVTAGKLYMVSMEFTYSGNNTAGDFQMGFGLAAGLMSANGHIQIPSAAGAVQNLYKNESGVNPLTAIAGGVPASGQPVAVAFTWAIVPDTTTTLKFQFGVNALTAGRTAVVHKGSIFRIKQVST